MASTQTKTSNNGVKIPTTHRVAIKKLLEFIEKKLRKKSTKIKLCNMPLSFATRSERAFMYMSVCLWKKFARIAGDCNEASEKKPMLGEKNCFSLLRQLSHNTCRYFVIVCVWRLLRFCSTDSLRFICFGAFAYTKKKRVVGGMLVVASGASSVVIRVDICAHTQTLCTRGIDKCSTLKGDDKPKAQSMSSVIKMRES